MKKKISIGQVMPKLFILIVICILCYPAISDIYNTSNNYSVINNYQEQVDELEDDEYSSLIEQARKYNESLIDNPERYNLSLEDMEVYMSLLNNTGDGIMGIISIDKINVNLPIYHTAEDKVLKIATGHVPGTSLPIGGKSTHTVISGHSGMASASLFTNLPKLAVGDTFKITVLNEVLIYEVDKIETILPSEIEKIEIVDNEDYCTLVSCTPIGINSHRLLVRGHRIEDIEEVVVQEHNNIVEEIVSKNIFTIYEIFMLSIAMMLFIIAFFYPFIKNIIKKIISS